MDARYLSEDSRMDPEVRIGVNVNVDVAAERQSTKNRLVVAFARTYLAEGNAGYLYPRKMAGDDINGAGRIWTYRADRQGARVHLRAPGIADGVGTQPG
eukprot:scaffold296859_cov33-Tisochrysis_lutea.AAC.6